MNLRSELKSALKWTAILLIPLAMIGGYFGNIHGGPGGYSFFIGLAILLPIFMLGSFDSSFGVMFWPFAIICQLLYWFLLVFVFRLVRLAWMNYRVRT